MKAIISDIHSNLEALQAVLEDIEKHDVAEIYCLGDVVGYGPNPRECVDLVMKCKIVLLGNHDQGAMFDPEGFNRPAERAIFWTRAQLEAPPATARPANKRLGVPGRTAADPPGERLPLRPRLGPQPAQRVRLPRRHLQPAQDGAHLRPGRALLLPGPHARPRHLHRERPCQFHSPEEIDYAYQLDGRKTLCNVGSVGQPRDGDWRACYVLLDDDTIRYRRVEYDIETTIKKIYAIADLENFLGDRLRDGR